MFKPTHEGGGKSGPSNVNLKHSGALGVESRWNTSPFHVCSQNEEDPVSERTIGSFTQREKEIKKNFRC